MRILLDTCVLIDALQNRQPFAREARALIDAAALRHYEAYVTAKEVTDLYYLMRHYLQTEAKARKAMVNLLSAMSILDTTSGEVQAALVTEMPDYEDAVMAQTAMRNEIDWIVTRNLKDYGNSCVPVCAPRDALEKLGIIEFDDRDNFGAR